MVIAKGQRSSISTQEEYLSAIDELDKPTFNDVRNLAVAYYYNGMEKANADAAYQALNRGTVVIETLEQCAAYFYSVGKKHQAHFKTLCEHLPDDLFIEEVDLLDWGCGQGLATMFLCDFLGAKRASIKTVTLIDPSNVALERAVTYVKKFLPDAEIRSFNENFGHCTCKIHMHLFANIIDVQDVNLESLASLLTSIHTWTDYFLCVNPAYQGNSRCSRECQQTCRLCQFTLQLQGQSIAHGCNVFERESVQYTIVKLSEELSTENLQHDGYKDYNSKTPIRGFTLKGLGLSEWPEVKVGTRRGQTAFYKISLNYTGKLVEAKCDINPTSFPIEDGGFLEYESWGAYTGNYYRIARKH